MAVLSYPTEVSLGGPWLIDAEQLEELDRVIEAHVPELNQAKEEEVVAKVEARMADASHGIEDQGRIERLRKTIEASVREFQGKDKRSVTIYLVGGRALQSQSFSDCIRQPHVDHEIALGFRCHIRIGEVEATISLSRGWKEDLSIDVTPNGSDLAQRLFGAIRHWAGNLQKTLLVRMWLKFKWFVPLLLFAWILMGLLISQDIAIEKKRSLQREEAHKLLQQGVNDSNRNRAVELILALESNYSSGGPTDEPGRRFWSYYKLGIIILAVLYFCPGVSIGLWAGKTKTQLWRWWLRTVTVSIPLLVFTSLIWPRIIELLL